MNKTSAAILMIVLAHVGLAWGGEIRKTVSKFPSDLRTPLGPQSNTVQKFTGISCYDVRDGSLQDCGFDMTITGLTPSALDVANNGGHNHHFDTHPVGDLSIVAPISAGPDRSLRGQTAFDVFIVSHKIPEVSGKIDTRLNLRVPTVPPGWRVVSPEPCDASGTSWCFVTTVDVGVPGLLSLPDGSAFYTKIRNPDQAHKDAVAFFGTPDALFWLGAIAEMYNHLSGNVLSVNDMSLLKGGVFDIRSNYVAPHAWHRVGRSADINTVQGDCFNNHELNIAVNMVMPTASATFYTPPTYSRSGRFLCERDGNIHIDLDVVPPPPPSPFQ